jgi:hypothetical protein
MTKLWKVIGPTAFKVMSDSRKRKFVRCKCQCGTVRYVQEASITSGRSRSCGCLGKKSGRVHLITHGHSVGGRTPEYGAWSSMLSRCRNLNDRNYPRYGGVGITVIKRWYKFENFLSDLGYRPPGMRLGRKDVNGSYTRLNTLWTTIERDSNNRRRSCRITYQGDRLTAAQWSRKLGLSPSTIAKRVQKGLKGKRALFG